MISNVYLLVAIDFFVAGRRIIRSDGFNGNGGLEFRNALEAGSGGIVDRLR